MYTFVTCFDKKHFDVYAEQMLRSVAKNWSSELRLVVYVEGYDTVDELPLNNFASNIEYRRLEEVEARTSFMERNADKKGMLEGQYNYRYDALRFCHKVYAYSDLALELIENEYNGWLVWIDADTITTSTFDVEAAKKIMPDDYDVVHLGRTDIDYSETGFIGWNLSYNNAASMILDIRGAYVINEVFAYREWTDAFVFERLLNIYKAHGMKALNLSEGVKGLAVFEQSILKDYFIHNKGNLKYAEAEEKIFTKTSGPKRYNQLADIVRHYSKGLETFTIVETGTWNGGRAIEMALAAFESVNTVHYRGFDLFEEATNETDSVELNVKKHHSTEEVGTRLAQFAMKMAEQGKKFTYRLYSGDTKETMRDVNFSDVDLTYIDGGHSYETVKSDYTFLKDVPVIVFDDYYSTSKGYEIPGEYRGIIDTFSEIESKRKYILASNDPTALNCTVHLAVVLKDSKDISDLPASLRNRPILVKPVDCMPSDSIKDNIRENVELIKDFDSIKHYKPVNDEIIIVSGGTIDFLELRKLIKKTNAKVFCVKHAYQRLLINDIKPYACVILDPRPFEGISTHGVKRTELFKKIDPTTKFFIASMTDPSVTKHILSKTDNVVGFHAFTDGIRDANVKDKVVVDPTLPIKKGAIMVTGGTCAATRTIGLTEILGHRNMHLFGFDCSIKEPKNPNEQDEEGRNKYLHVETGGEQFYTTGELLALAQDLEKMFENKNLNLNIQFHGKHTLASQVFNQSYYNMEYLTYEETKKNA